MRRKLAHRKALAKEVKMTSKEWHERNQAMKRIKRKEKGDSSHSSANAVE